jgi:hypothetical protein
VVYRFAATVLQVDSLQARPFQAPHNSRCYTLRAFTFNFSE